MFTLPHASGGGGWNQIPYIDLDHSALAYGAIQADEFELPRLLLATDSRVRSLPSSCFVLTRLRTRSQALSLRSDPPLDPPPGQRARSNSAWGPSPRTRTVSPPMRGACQRVARALPDPRNGVQWTRVLMWKRAPCHLEAPERSRGPRPQTIPKAARKKRKMKAQRATST